MSISTLVESKVFRSLSIAVTLVTAYAPSALGLNAIGSSVADMIRQIARRPVGHYTTAPGVAYLGKHPGRDPMGRGGVWKKPVQSKAAHSGGRLKVATSY